MRRHRNTILALASIPAHFFNLVRNRPAVLDRPLRANLNPRRQWVSTQVQASHSNISKMRFVASTDKAAWKPKFSPKYGALIWHDGSLIYRILMSVTRNGFLREGARRHLTHQKEIPQLNSKLS